MVYPVTFDGDVKAIVFVAFDRQAAEGFVSAEQSAWEREYADYIEECGGSDLPLVIDEVSLIDNYGFPCTLAEAGVVAPWLGDVSDTAMRFYGRGA